MAVFTYRATDSKGRRVCGHRNVESEETIRQYLDSKELAEYTIFASDTIFASKLFKYVSPNELSIFCRQMSVMFFSPITLMEGVLMLSEQTENKQLQIALEEIHNIMEQGYTLAEAMGMYGHVFTNYMLNMINIGEASGTLDAVFLNLSEYFEKESKIRKKIKTAVIYPAVLAVLLSSIVLLLIIRVLPMFEDLLNSMGGELPVVTKTILSTATLANTYFIVILIIICIASAGAVFYFRTKDGKYTLDMLKFRIPVFRYITSRLITARVSRSLSILLKSGMQLENALDDVKALMNNRYLDSRFAEAVERVKEGEQLDIALDEMMVFPPLFIKMVHIGQSTGHLDSLLDKSADIFDDEANEGIDKLTSILEPLMIIILSVIVGVILVSVMLPMISIMNSIG